MPISFEYQKYFNLSHSDFFSKQILNQDDNRLEYKILSETLTDQESWIVAQILKYFNKQSSICFTSNKQDIKT